MNRVSVRHKSSLCSCHTKTPELPRSRIQNEKGTYMGRPKSNTPRSSVTNVRLTEDERASVEEMAKNMGFANVSEYVRFIHNQVLANKQSAGPDAAESLRSRFPTRKIGRARCRERE